MKYVAFMLLVLTTGCSTSTSTVDNSLTGIPAGARFAIGAVTLDPDAAKGQDPAVVERARNNTSWGAWVKRGFEQEAKELGIDGGPVKVDIHILKVDPGSEEARFWSRSWGGHGSMVVKASVARHGDLTVKGGISSGAFDQLCEKVGSKVARELERRRGKD